MPMPKMNASDQPATAAAADYAALMRPADPTPAGQAARLAVAPSDTFVLRHHPSNWEVESLGLDGPTWLPDISKLVLTAGAHLVRTIGKGEDPEAATRHAFDVDRHNGWYRLDATRVIPADCLPPGVPPGGYVRVLPCKDPRSEVSGNYHLEAWDMPRPPVPGAQQRFVFDRAAYNRWRLWLVTSGQIPEPDDATLADTVAARVPRLQRISALPIPDDLRKVRVGAVEGEIARMEDAAVPSMAAAPAPKPAASTGPRKPLSKRAAAEGSE